ncbi:MAG: hypothetical protein JNL67_12845 [Planctomycetaceae bacterium]|nr:hypothetical protein [Planctomycetaceae bacterium]
MCCFAQQVEFVEATKIFARLTDRSTQYLVYQMTFSTKTPNAMILPIPVRAPAREGSVKFINLEDHPGFFESLAELFPSLYRKSAAGSIPVHSVGDYIASFVPSIDDFENLDPAFVIPKSTWDQIPGYANFSFAVFQLTKLQGTPHPMAFEFETRTPDQVFFPTLHIHDGMVHETEEFDHQLFVQHAMLDDLAGSYVDYDYTDPATGFVRSRPAAGTTFADMPAPIVDPNLLVHRLRIDGFQKNQDYTFSMTRLAFLSGMIRKRLPWLIGTPLALAGAAFGWLHYRRNKLRGTKKQVDSELSLPPEN